MDVWFFSSTPAIAGFVAGAMNAMAGGGSFVALPALIAAGVPSVSANASATVALYPGGVASVWVYRDGLGRVCGVPLVPMLVATLAGGFVGALLLLWTPTAFFDRLLPWLLLGGAVGLMMMAVWGLLGGADVGAMAPPRTLMVTAANTIALVCFVVAGAVAWPQTLLLGAGALTGGFAGALIGKRLSPALVRAGTVLVAAAMTMIFFARSYG